MISVRARRFPDHFTLQQRDEHGAGGDGGAADVDVDGDLADVLAARLRQRHQRHHDFLQAGAAVDVPVAGALHPQPEQCPRHLHLQVAVEAELAAVHVVNAGCSRSPRPRT